MKSLRQKVIGKTPRDPVNKQTAMIIAPMRGWLSKPLPPEAGRNVVELEAEISNLKRQLSDRRDSESKLNRLIGKLTERVGSVDKECEKLRNENLALRQELHKLLIRCKNR